MPFRMPLQHNTLQYPGTVKSQQALQLKRHNMPILRSTPASPFGRKVKIAAGLAGIYDRFEHVNANVRDPDDDLRSQNPLGKIPVLVLDDGTAIYDSRVIAEWIDDQAGGDVIIPKGKNRLDALILQALADGMMDASILIVYEGRYRPEELHFQPWLDYQNDKVQRALNRLEHESPETGDKPHIGHVALACALGYLDFRFAGKWRNSFPQMVSWLDAFALAVPAFELTAPHDS